MDLRERFLDGIDHVEAHLFEPLRLGDVATRAGLSPHYFSRLFRVLTGETFGSYVRRRRMAIAAKRLRSEGPELRLIDLALDCQYDSQEAFTRAFKRAVGQTPGAYRTHPQPPATAFRRRLDATMIDHLQEALCMEPEIVELDAFLVVGVRARFDTETKHRIPQLWERFRASAAELPVSTEGITYGVCLNNDPDDGSFDYIAGIEVEKVDALPEGLIAETVPRQTYASFTHRVQSPQLHDEIQRTLHYIWATWLAQAPFDVVPGPDFERYSAGFRPEPGHSLEICIPVRAVS